MRRCLIALAAVLGLLPTSVEAQAAVQPEDLIRIVRTEESIVVIDLGGRRTRGTLTAVDANSLSLAMDGQTRAFAWSEVSRIRLADGVGNGALIGAGVGLGAAIGILAILAVGEGYVLPSAKVGAPLLLSGVGALMGALVDRAHDSGRVLYESAGQSVGLTFSPFLGTGRPCVLVTVRF